jgi:hypothetical protein
MGNQRFSNTIANPAKLLTVVSVIKEPVTGLEKTHASVIREFGTCPEVEYLIKECASPGAGSQLTSADNSSTAFEIRHLRQPDSNVFEGMNQATHAASGKWILFLNAGDWFINGFGEICQRFLEHHSNCDYVYADGITVDATDGREFLRKAPHPLQMHHFLHRAPYLHPCLLIKRTWLLEHPFDTSFDLAADFKLMVQLVAHAKVGHYLPTPAACILSGGLSEKHRIRAKTQALKALCIYSPNRSFKLRALAGYLRFLILNSLIKIVRKIPAIHRMAKKQTKGQPSGTFT